LIEFRIAELQGRLRLARRFHLTQEVGHVIGAKGPRGESFPQGHGNLLGAVSSEQIEQFTELAKERTIGIGQTAQIRFHRFWGQQAAQQSQQALWRLGTVGGRALEEPLFFKALGAESLTARPGARLADDLRSLRIIECDRRGIGFRDQLLADPAGRGPVTVGIKVPAQIFVYQHFDRVAIIGGQCGQGT
jgi:hypothetical protein